MICDSCGYSRNEIAKVPCAYFVNKNLDGTYSFIAPNDESKYMNICLDCLTKGVNA